MFLILLFMIFVVGVFENDFDVNDLKLIGYYIFY